MIIKAMIKTLKIAFFLLLLLQAQVQQAQGSLTIEACYDKAEQNFPSIQKFELLEKSKDYTIENISKGIYPRLTLFGQATYQSAVTSFPISLPNVDIPKVSNDQYKLYGEISQGLTEFGMVKQQKELVKANSAVETQKVKVELYQIKETINQLFFGILLTDEQLELTKLLKKDLRTGIDRITAAIQNDIAIPTDTLLLYAELLQLNEKIVELNYKKKAVAQVLSLLIGETVSEQTILERPTVLELEQGINRPELALFALQKSSIAIEHKLLKQKNLPHVNLFFQGGLGRPALNFLSNDLEGYYIGGLRLNWNFNGFLAVKNEKRLLDIKEQFIDVQQKTFLFNTNLQLAEQNEDIKKYAELLAIDNQIIEVRKKIKTVAQEQLSNGIITINDYVNYINAEDKAQQNLKLHQMQLLMAQYLIKTKAGN